MKFTPKTEAQIAEDNLWPAGEYGFDVLDEVAFSGKLFETKDTQSKAGNDMIQLVLKVYNADGHFITIIDYLLESIAYKLRHAAGTCGLIAKYESGSLSAEDFKGRSGFLKLKIGKANGDYPAKNEVADYIVKDGADASHAPLTAAKAPTGGFIDDSIPFMRRTDIA